MNITPKGRYLLVRFIPPVYSSILEVVHDPLVEEKKNSAIEDRIQSGVVLAIGPKVRANVKVGETVYFSQLVKKHAGRAIGADPNLLLILDQGLAFVDEAKEAAA